MAKAKKSKLKNRTIQNTIDIIIKIGVLLLILGWCFQIIRPFINIVLWAVIIAIATFPAYKFIRKKIGNRRKLAAGLLTLLLITILIVPAIFLADSLIDGIKDFRSNLDTGSICIPPPPDKVSDWPLIGSSLFSVWQSASVNFEGLVKEYGTELLAAGQWIVKALLGTSMGLIQFLLSVIIAGVLLAGSDKILRSVLVLFKKLAGKRGKEYANTSEITIRNVAKGVLGVAIIQSILLGIIFILAGVPYAGLWALLCLFFAVIQVGPIVVTIPVIIYLFASIDPWLALIWTILIVLASLLDNFLKPILMGKGAPVPMLVIFLGAIGGFIASGFIGLFIGAIILSLGYKLYLGWLEA